MTAKEKAQELVAKYKDAPFNCQGCDMPFCDILCTMLGNYEAVQCALIAVDEIMDELTAMNYGLQYLNKMAYWNEVYKNIVAL